MTVIMKIGKIRHTKDLKGFGESVNDFLHGQSHLYFMLKKAMLKGYNEWKKYVKTFGRNRPKDSKFMPGVYLKSKMTLEEMKTPDVIWYTWTIECENKDFEKDQYEEAKKIYEAPDITKNLKKFWNMTKDKTGLFKKIEQGESQLKAEHKTIQNKLLDCGILTDISITK